MDPAAATEALRQVMMGEDIPAPESLLKNVTSEKATIQLPWMPYSILTNLAHADFWQQIWLDRLNGKRARSFTEDWKTPPPAEWTEVKRRFLEGLSRAHEIASAKPFHHQMKSDAIAVKTLMQIALHDAYHLGQIKLLKRELRLHGLLDKKEDPQDA